MIALTFYMCLIILGTILQDFLYKNILKQYQLNGYSVIKTIKTFNLKDILILVLLSIFFNILFFTTKTFYFLSFYIVCFYFICFIYYLKTNNKFSKNKIVFTKRFTRFYVLNIILNLAYFFAMLFLTKNNYFYFVLVNFYVSCFLLFIVSHILILPFEMLVKQFYIQKAKQKLKTMPNLIVIGITGSYGKTSVKNYLYEFLKTKYKVCKTEKSFNTPMGFTKVILNNLKPNDEILILEYGADHNHDINKLCKIVKPNYSIITGVVNQHLKTFKTFENIKNTKYELVENTSQKGAVVFNGDNKITKEFYKKTNIQKYLVSTKNNCKFYASNLQIFYNKTEFILNASNNKYTFETKLLGKHNVINLLLALKMAEILGINLNELVNLVNTLSPVEHRLNLIENAGKFILDDSFNANTEGVYSALEVLNTFKNKKIVITAGVVELGKLSYKENFKLGKALQKYDVVIITNYINKQALFDGLKGGKNKVFFAENLDKALEILQPQFNTGDCVLFLNDLPDSYK